VSGNLLLDLLDLLIEIGDMPSDGGLDGHGCRPEAIHLLSAHADQGVDASDQGLQVSNLGCRWLPGLRVHGQAEAGNETGIHLVILCPKQLTLGKALDPGRVDDTDRVNSVVQVQGQLIAIAPCGLEAGMKAIHSLLPEPVRQGLKTIRAVLAGFVFKLPSDE
jgi:hypothetical protein